MIDQNIAVWRSGFVFDPTGGGKTAIKASYSRYGLQVGIDRVTAVNPLGQGSRTCPWSDPNGDGKFQTSEITLSQCGGFSGGVNTRYSPDGVDWPYSDEVTAGIERQVMQRHARRRDVLLPHQSRSGRHAKPGSPPSAYIPFTIAIPNGPGGSVANPQPTTAVIYNLPASLASAGRQHP